VPLNALAKLTYASARSRSHLGQLPSVTFSFDLRPGIARRRRSRKSISHAELQVPPTLNTTFQGTAQAFQARSRHGLLLLLAIVVIYLVLGILYESFVIRSRSCRLPTAASARC